MQTFEGDVHITGNLTVSGDIAAFTDPTNRWYLCSALLTKHKRNGDQVFTHCAGLFRGCSEDEARGAFVSDTMKVFAGYQIADVVINEVSVLG